MNARFLRGFALAAVIAAGAGRSGPALAASTLHVPEGTEVRVRPLAPLEAASLARGVLVVLQVESDVTIEGHLVFARGALARGTILGPLRERPLGVRIDWIMDTSGDEVTTTGVTLSGPLPLTARIHGQDVNVPDTYDPSVR